MPAIVSLEDLKAARKDLRSMFLAVTPYASRLKSLSACCFSGIVRQIPVGANFDKNFGFELKPILNREWVFCFI